MLIGGSEMKKMIIAICAIGAIASVAITAFAMTED